MQDEFLFFRFYEDERHGQLDSYQVSSRLHFRFDKLELIYCMQAKEPARKKLRWRFRPNNTALSVVVTTNLVQVNVHPGSVTAYSTDEHSCVLLATRERCCKWRPSRRRCRGERHTGPVRIDNQRQKRLSPCS